MAITDAFRAIIGDYAAGAKPSIPTEQLVGKVLIFSDAHEDDTRAGGRFLVFSHLQPETPQHEKTYLLARLDEPDEAQPYLGIWAHSRNLTCHGQTKLLPISKGGMTYDHMLGIFMMGGWQQLENGAQNLGNGVQYTGQQKDIDNLLRGRLPSPTFKIVRGLELEKEGALCKLMEGAECQVIPATPESVFSDTENEKLVFEAGKGAGRMDTAGWDHGRN